MPCPWDIQGQAVVGTEQPDGAVDAPSIAGELDKMIFGSAF